MRSAFTTSTVVRMHVGDGKSSSAASRSSSLVNLWKRRGSTGETLRYINVCVCVLSSAVKMKSNTRNVSVCQQVSDNKPFTYDFTYSLSGDDSISLFTSSPSLHLCLAVHEMYPCAIEKVADIKKPY